MPSLTKSLEKRIQELITSIDAQKTELAAYQRVLALETGKLHSSDETPTMSAATYMSNATPEPETHHSGPSSQSTPDLSSVQFNGNKTNLVEAVVQKYGALGATPKEVDAIFTDRNVPRSKNLIYNTLSYLVAHKKLVRKQSRYYAIGLAVRATKKSARGPKRVAGIKRVAGTKRKISAEGIKRIREANQKRWAAKKASDAEQTKPAAQKKRGRKKAVKTV